MDRPFALKPYYAGATAVVGGLAGLFGSIYSAQIATVRPFSLLLEAPVDQSIGPVIASMLFLVTLFLFGVMFGAGFRAQIQSQDAATTSLTQSVTHASTAFQGQLELLEQTVRSLRSLPPDSFLIEFEDQFHTAFAMAADALACEDKATLEQQLADAIQGCLAAMLLLAQNYDPPDHGVHYTVTLMVMKPLPVDQAQRADVRGRLQMVEAGCDLDSLEGVLELDPAFTMSTDPERMGGVRFVEEQDSAASVMLPVPKMQFRMDDNRSTVLPGAPAAWCSPSKLQYIPNVSALVEHLRLNSALRPSVATAAEQYFAHHKQGRDVKSFIALPFGVPSDRTREFTRSFGVVNVHSSTVDLLGMNQAAMYAPLTSPLRVLLGLLWQRWEKLT